MKVEFSDIEVMYLYGTLLKDLEKFEKQKKLNRDNIKLHKQLIASLEKACPQLKLISPHHQDKTDQSQKA